jgi:hypothetical protein
MGDQIGKDKPSVLARGPCGLQFQAYCVKCECVDKDLLNSSGKKRSAEYLAPGRWGAGRRTGGREGECALQAVGQ